MGLVFPNYYDKEEDATKLTYNQFVTGTFNNIVQADGQLAFSDTQVSLQGEPVFIGPNSQLNKLRYIDGTAWVSASNNPRIPEIKIKLSVGSQDVEVVSQTKTVTDPSWKESFEGGGGIKPGGVVGWVVSKFVNIDVKLGVKFERSGEVKSGARTRTMTAGQLSQQRVWTLSLLLPEPKAPPPPPGPFGLPEPYKVYFETGKSNADHYRSPLTRGMDQIKGLQEYMNAIDKSYGLDNIDSATVLGYASGLGDTRGNIDLSLNRARYVADLLSKLYYVQIPPSKIISRGEPIMANDKDNNPEERRAELSVKIKGSARR
jgi:outer membrane protein OmpA-like peptidoglycan-associated protein